MDIIFVYILVSLPYIAAQIKCFIARKNYEYAVKDIHNKYVVEISTIADMLVMETEKVARLLLWWTIGMFVVLTVVFNKFL